MKRLIKLVHVTTVPQSLSFVAKQVGYMKARGFDVYGLSSPGTFLTLFAESEGIQVMAVDMPRRITPMRDLVAIFKIWRLLRQIQPQIVHAHTPKGGLLGMLGAWLGRVPVRLYHMHGLPYLTASGWRKSLLMWSEYLSCRLAHRVICVSASLRAVAVDAGLCPAEKIRVLLRGSCNGVDAAVRFNPALLGDELRIAIRRKYHIPCDAMVAGFVGRIVRSKGLVELADAWAALRQEFPSLHLLLVGPAEPGDPLPPEIARRLHDDPRVHLVGEEWDIPPVYAAMDVLLLPTYREGFGNVLIEAAAMKLGIVATNVPGCVDAVQDGVTGTLIPPHDPRQLAEAVRRYLGDPELRHRHGEAARVRVLRDFSDRAIWQAVYEVYLEILEEKGISAPDASIATTQAEKELVTLSPDRTLSDQLSGQGSGRKETEAVSAGGFRPAAGPS